MTSKSKKMRYNDNVRFLDLFFFFYFLFSNRIGTETALSISVIVWAFTEGMETLI